MTREFIGIHESNSEGIFVNGNVTIRSSNISEYDQGIWIMKGDSHIDGCIIQNNSIGIYYWGGNHVIRNSIISQNPDLGIKSEIIDWPPDSMESVTVDARYNYWGSENGPYHPTENSAGWGDTVGNDIEFSNWHKNQDFTPYTGDEDGEDDFDPLPLILMGTVIAGVVGILLFGMIKMKRKQ